MCWSCAEDSPFVLGSKFIERRRDFDRFGKGHSVIRTTTIKTLGVFDAIECVNDTLGWIGDQDGIVASDFFRAFRRPTCRGILRARVFGSVG